MISTLAGLKKFMKDLNITFTHGTAKSSKKELYKFIDKIMSWEIGLYTSYLKKS